MNQWYFQNRSSLVHSEDHYSSVYSGVVRMKDGNVISHYGVKGMHWGEITKEYEPVAVDHRKLKTAQLQTPNYRISTKPRMSSAAGRKAAPTMSRKQARAMRRREREGYYTKDANGRIVWHQNGKEFSPAEERQKLVKKAMIGAGVVAGLLITYGAVRYAKVQRAKAYSGILNRFISQNPGALKNTSEGRKLMKRGMSLARANSSKKLAKSTNKYLGRKGLNLKGRDAMRMYKGRKDVEKQLKYAFDRKKVLTYLKKFGRA